MNQEVINAAHFNQSGAFCFESNQLEQAQEYFQLALESVTLAGHDLYHGCNKSCPQHHQLNRDSLMLSKESVPTTSPHESERHIYSKPFFFNPTAVLTKEEIAPYGGVILFNLALAYHKRSRTAGESSLHIAVKLYEKCLSLLKQATNFDCSNVIIAALNNQARIYEELADHQSACLRFKVLAEFLNREGVRTDTMEENDLQDICLNIFFFKVPSCAAVA